MRVRRHTSVFIALVLACGLAACGDDDADESSSDEPAATTTVVPADAVDIVMTENAFAVSGALKPGGTIRLSNAGREFHLMFMGKLKPGKTLDDLLAVLAAPPPAEEGPTTTAAAGGDATTTTAGGDATTTTAGGETTTTAAASGAATTTTTAGGPPAEEQNPLAEVVDDVGLPGAIQGPGERADITAPDLGAGSYALICFIPTEGGGPPHFAQGMFGQLTVAGEKAEEPTADATFVVEPGKPVTGPSALTAGRHVLKMEAAAGADVELLEPVLVKLDAGKTIADVNRAFESFETPDDFVVPLNAAAQVPGKLVAGLFDFGPSNRSVYIAVDLAAGTYGVVANDTDPDDAPEDPVEKTTFTVT